MPDVSLPIRQESLDQGSKSGTDGSDTAIGKHVFPRKIEPESIFFIKVMVGTESMSPESKIYKIDPTWEDSFLADENRRILLPEHFYQVQCTSYEKGHSHRNALKLFLWFKIIDGVHMGKALFMAINLIDPKTKAPYKPFPQGSKYYEQWVIANYNKKPSRRDQMSPKIFKDGIFEAYVRTVKPLFPDRTEKPECFHYSIIDYLKRRTA